jgi:hypothetical protein
LEIPFSGKAEKLRYAVISAEPVPAGFKHGAGIQASPKALDARFRGHDELLSPCPEKKGALHFLDFPLQFVYHPFEIVAFHLSLAQGMAKVFYAGI